MATKVHMEALSPTMEEGQVVKWLKSEGDEVTNGEVLAEIETDKATMELSARGAGVLRKILVREGGTAEVGSVIAVIAAEDEDISALVDEAGGNGAAPEGGEGEEEAGEEASPEGAEDARGAPEATPTGAEQGHGQPSAEAPAPMAEAPTAVSEAPAPRAGEAGRRIKASPLARRLAGEAGLDLQAIEGSGPGGRIVKRDVEEAKERGVPAAPAAAAFEAPEGEYEDVPLTQMRKTIARRLAGSIGPVPHYFLTVDVDMSRVVEARRRMNALLEEGGERVSV
ncbi:MAG TPA: biotin/lipoyl-containing protein, partial [Longimicrobiales bacterium]|nr:biotin/lipoyl-containing protein [Longimicrobiales bacterium]